MTREITPSGTNTEIPSATHLVTNAELALVIEATTRDHRDRVPSDDAILLALSRTLGVTVLDARLQALIPVVRDRIQEEISGYGVVDAYIKETSREVVDNTIRDWRSWMGLGLIEFQPYFYEDLAHDNRPAWVTISGEKARLTLRVTPFASVVLTVSDATPIAELLDIAQAEMAAGRYDRAIAIFDFVRSVGSKYDISAEERQQHRVLLADAYFYAGGEAAARGAHRAASLNLYKAQQFYEHALLGQGDTTFSDAIEASVLTAQLWAVRRALAVVAIQQGDTDSTIDKLIDVFRANPANWAEGPDAAWNRFVFGHLLVARRHYKDAAAYYRGVALLLAGETAQNGGVYGPAPLDAPPSHQVALWASYHAEWLSGQAATFGDIQTRFENKLDAEQRQKFEALMKTAGVSAEVWRYVAPPFDDSPVFPVGRSESVITYVEFNNKAVGVTAAGRLCLAHLEDALRDGTNPERLTAGLVREVIAWRNRVVEFGVELSPSHLTGITQVQDEFFKKWFENHALGHPKTIKDLSLVKQNKMARESTNPLIQQLVQAWNQTRDGQRGEIPLYDLLRSYSGTEGGFQVSTGDLLAKQVVRKVIADRERVEARARAGVPSGAGDRYLKSGSERPKK